MKIKMLPETNPYAYAKACGIIGKSFLGKRISSLAGLRSLNDLERSVFPDSYRELPGRELLADLEKRIIARAVRQIMMIAGSYSNPPELIVRMIRTYEYNDLKACIQNILAGKKELPEICNIGRFGTVRFSAYPDFVAMLGNTEFNSFILQDLKPVQAGSIVANSVDIISVEAKINFLYYNGLINSLGQLTGEVREITQRILADEISLRNCAWALRLRTYYHKGAGEIGKFLMDIKLQEKKRNISLASDALKSLDFPLDSRSSWSGWKWENLLNPEDVHMHWAADPRYFQNAASFYLYRLALACFHRLPMSISSIFCFIKLKQFEEDLLTSMAEGLALGMDGNSVLQLMEVLS